MVVPGLGAATMRRVAPVLEAVRAAAFAAKGKKVPLPALLQVAVGTDQVLLHHRRPEKQKKAACARAGGKASSGSAEEKVRKKGERRTRCGGAHNKVNLGR